MLPLDLAIAEELFELSDGDIELALESNGLWEDDDGKNILHYAIKLGNKEKFIFLFNHYPELHIEPYGRSLLHYAVEGPSLGILEYLLQDKHVQNDCTIYGNTPTHFAVRYGTINIVKALVKRFGLETRCNERGENILHWAAASNNNDMIRFLLKTYPEQMAQMWTQNKDGTPDDVVLNLNNDATLPSEILYKLFGEKLHQLKNNLTAEDAKMLTAFKTNLTYYLTQISEEHLSQIPCHKIYDFVSAQTISTIVERQISSTQPLQKSHIKSLLVVLEKSFASQFFLYTAYLLQSDLYQQLRALHHNFIDNEYLVVQGLSVIIHDFYMKHGFDCQNSIIKTLEKIVIAKRKLVSEPRFDVPNTFQSGYTNLEEYLHKYYAYHQLIKPSENFDESPETIKRWITQKFPEVDKNSLSKFLAETPPQPGPFQNLSINGELPSFILRF